jgi:DNA modification methylase
MIERVAVEQLRPAPYNPRKISDDAMARLEKSIQEWGLVDPLIWNKRTGNLVGGHQRLKVLKKRGETAVDCVVVDLPPSREKALNVALNNQKMAGEYDFPLLADLLQEIDTGEFDIGALTGFSESDLEEIAAWTPDGEREETEPVPEPPEEAVSKLGDVWELGKHRLMCADATNGDDVSRLLDGDVPFLCVTDPPYGVDYDPAWRVRAAEAGYFHCAARRVGEVRNDDRADWSAAWKLFPGDVLYSWHPPGATSLIHAKAIQDSGFTLRMQIIWAKSNFPIGRGDYHVRHEPCWYAVRDGKPAKRTEDRTQSTLWEINLDKNVEGGHSTQKPVECMARPIRNHHAQEVYDPFVGSGTTIIAAEKLGRRCYAIEIEPRYVDVAVKRWQNFAGKEAKNLTRPDVKIG